jgi:hypothetical protein
VRIVFVGHGDAAALAKLPGKPAPLGKAKSGVWLELADDALLAAWGLGARLDIVYLSRAAYDHAVRKLEPKDAAEAVEERHRTYSATALDQAVSWLGARGRRAIALAAKAAPLHVERVLAQLVLLETEGRFAMLTPRERVFGLAEGEAGLLAELRDLRADLTAEITAREAFYVEHARALEALGQKGLVDAPLYVGLARVYGVTPAEGTDRFFRTREDPQTTWRDAAVGPIAHKDAQRWRDAGKTLTLLLPSRGQLFAVLDLTAAQRQVELDERAKDPGLADHLAQLRIELAIRKRALVPLVPAAAAVVLKAQIAKDKDRLVAALAAEPVLGAAAPPPLPAEEQQRADDARFLAAWARIGGRLELSLARTAHAELVVRDAKAL